MESLDSLPTSDIRWGIDLGGTKIEIACFSIENNEPKVVLRERCSTQAELGYAHVVKELVNLAKVSEKQAGHKIKKLGIGHPGVHCPKTGLIKNSNSQVLQGENLKSDLLKAFKKEGMDISLNCANDANCFALAESAFGAGRGYGTVFGVIMGTGVGGGVIIGDKALYGGHGISGEWGHVVVDPSGKDCYCGRKGCVETIISGPALEKFYENLSGESGHISEIIARADVDKNALLTKNRLIEFFGKGLSYVTNIVDPECIVLGGGVSNVDCLYTDGKEELSKWIFNDGLDIPVKPAELGDSAGVFGAGML